MNLIPRFDDKPNYLLHYRNLQLYLFLGIKLTIIHRMLKFKQSDWMKKYINFDTEKQQTLQIVLKNIFLKIDY